MTARTNSWDAVGVVSYGLLFTFFESLIVFLAATLLGFLISSKWDEKKRIALMGVIFIVLPLWSILNQTYFLREMEPSEGVIGFYISTGRPLVALYITALMFTGVSFVLPTYALLTSSKVEKTVLEGFDRLSLLMILYLVFDVAALVVILIRNF
ncbi:MAG: hypothetical protein HYU84_09130 [Chloroflexi bacterium]|nr:hypothetical protein [Chloroflexota bacterium]MBI3169042.1 hypothetical protein [Chloroflexota bacterium]